LAAGVQQRIEHAVALQSGTQPLSSVVRLCVTVVERNVSGRDHLRSVALLAAVGGLRFDATLWGGLAVVVIVVVVVIMLTCHYFA